MTTFRTNVFIPRFAENNRNFELLLSSFYPFLEAREMTKKLHDLVESFCKSLMLCFDEQFKVNEGP